MPNLTRFILVFVLAIVLLLGVGKAVLREGEFYLLTIFSILVFPVLVGYIFLVVGLLKGRKWAWDLLFFMLIVTAMIEFLSVLILNLWVNFDWVQGFFDWFFGLSLLIFPVFGIAALIRKLLKRK
ncbi:MAG: hypothetical protein NT060_01595 [Candidatus Omnitrophica bacterium]|nr:hypothetical protein [Candidatus Omnitrophota bacterium]